MTVICPKCQLENPVNATQAPLKSRIICARCATLIEVKADQNASVGNGRGQVASPFVQSRDPYATRVEPDYDEVLEIPLAAQVEYQTGEQVLLLDDIFAPPSDAPPAPAVEPAPPEPRVTVPLREPRLPKPQGEVSTGAPKPVSSEDHVRESHPELQEGVPALPNGRAPFPEPPVATWAESPAGSAKERPAADWTEQPATNWPVLADEPSASSTSANSILGRMVLRVAAMIVIGLGLVYLAWHFLGDRLMRRNDQGNQVAATRPASNNQTASSTASVGATARPTVAPGTAPGVAIEPQVPSKPGSEAAKPDPQANTKATQPAVAAKPEAKKPIEVPMTGHSVKQSEGSLTIQVASYTERSPAEAEAARLKSAGVEARVVRAEVPNKGTRYRVQIGRFTSQEEADRLRAQLRARGVVRDAIIVGFQAP